MFSYLKRLKDLWDWVEFANAALTTIQTKSGLAVVTSLVAMIAGGFTHATWYEIVLMGLVVFVAVNIFSISRLLRIPKPAFEFVFDQNDARWVRVEQNRTRYFVGLHILSHQTVDAPNVWALTGEFTSRIYAHRRMNPHPSGDIPIYGGGALDPNHIETIALFDLPPRQFLDNRGLNNPLRTVQRFTLEARGRHCRAVRSEFEFDPDKTPMVRMLP